MLAMPHIGDEDRGIYFNINRWNFILPKFVWITNIILLSDFKPMYLLESNIPNESSNIFMRRKKSRMNVRIYSRWKNPRIFKRMNTFVNKYSNIFEYPNIRYTLICISQCSCFRFPDFIRADLNVVISINQKYVSLKSGFHFPDLKCADHNVVTSSN